MALAITGRPWDRRRMNPSRRIRPDLRRPVGIALGVHGPADPIEHAADFARPPGCTGGDPLMPSRRILPDPCHPCDPWSNPSGLSGEPTTSCTSIDAETWRRRIEPRMARMTRIEKERESRPPRRPRLASMPPDSSLAATASPGPFAEFLPRPARSNPRHPDHDRQTRAKIHARLFHSWQTVGTMISRGPRCGGPLRSDEARHR